MGFGDGSLRLRRNERPVLGFAPPGALCGRRFPAPAARCVAGAAGHCSAASIGVALPARAGRDSPRLVQAERARAPPDREARRGRRVRRARARPAGTKRSLVPGGHRAFLERAGTIRCVPEARDELAAHVPAVGRRSPHAACGGLAGHGLRDDLLRAARRAGVPAGNAVLLLEDPLGFARHRQAGHRGRHGRAGHGRGEIRDRVGADQLRRTASRREGADHAPRGDGGAARRRSCATAAPPIPAPHDAGGGTRCGFHDRRPAPYASAPIPRRPAAGPR